MSQDVERIPDNLRKWIEEDGLVRVSMSEPFGGLCGGVVKRNNGNTIDGGVFCRRAAGFNTDHHGYGRCFHHDEQAHTDGLAPWVGPLTDDEWKVLTGSESNLPTHRSRQVLHIYRSWEEWLTDALPEDEIHAFKTMPTDPVGLLDQEIKLNRLMAARIHRWLQQERMAQNMDAMQIGGTARDLRIVQAETQLLKISATFARLMEVRARLSEVASAEENQGWMEEALRGMPQEDFSKLSSEPNRLLTFLNRGDGQ